MSEMNAQKIPDVVLLGDLSRFELLEWLLPEFHMPEWKNEIIWVQYGEQNDIIHTENGWDIFSCWMIPRMLLMVLPEGADIRQLTLKKDCRLLLFEGDRFGKETTRRLMMTLDGPLREQSKRIVLLDEKQRRASTDMNREQDAHAADDQCAAYIQNGWDAILIKPSGEERIRQLMELLNWKEPEEKRWNRLFREKLKDFELEIQMLEWDSFQLPVFDLHRIFGFDAERFERQKRLWWAYAQMTEEILFKKDGKSLLSWAVEEYINAVSCVIEPSLLSKEKLRGSLETELRTTFWEKMRDPSMEQICLTDVTEAAYSNTVNESKIEAAFRKKLSFYLEKDVIEVIQNQLWKKYEQLKGILK